MTLAPKRRSGPVRIAQLGVGIAAMLAAPIVGIPAPGPVGTFVFAFGLALVLRNSPRARRHYVRRIRNYPRLQRIANFGLRRKSKRRPPESVAATTDHQMLSAAGGPGLGSIAPTHKMGSGA